MDIIELLPPDGILSKVPTMQILLNFTLEKNIFKPCYKTHLAPVDSPLHNNYMMGELRWSYHLDWQVSWHMELKLICICEHHVDFSWFSCFKYPGKYLQMTSANRICEKHCSAVTVTLPAKALASSVGTALRWRRSLLLPTSMITMLLSAWSCNSFSQRSAFSYVRCLAMS